MRCVLCVIVCTELVDFTGEAEALEICDNSGSGAEHSVQCRIGARRLNQCLQPDAHITGTRTLE